MSNPKVFEFAKEIGMTPLALMDKIREWQLPVKSHMAELEPTVLDQIKVKLSHPEKSADNSNAEKKPAARKKAAATPSPAAKPTSTAKPAVKVAAKVAAPVAIPAVAPAVAPVVRRKSKVAEENTKELAKEAAEVDLHEAADIEVVAEIKEVPVVHVEEPPVQKVQTPKVAMPEVVAKKTEPAKTETVVAPVVKTEVATVVATPAQASAPAKVDVPAAATVATPAPTPAAPAAARKKEVSIGNSGVASNPAPRRNIIGRMDLSRVSQPQQSGPRFGGGGDRPGGGARPMQSSGGPGGAASQQRNKGHLRTGFVQASTIPDVIPFEEQSTEFDRKKEDKRRNKVAAPAETNGRQTHEEEAVKHFDAAEFRKREMVFQPKKKKGMLSRPAMHTQITKPKASKRVLKINQSIKVAELAVQMGIKAPELIKVLIKNGVMANMTMNLDFDTVALVVPDLGFEAVNSFKSAEEVMGDTAFGDLDAKPIVRPPVVTIMGHVDHGKTSLLDAIRNANVAQGEAGGITQHIGAYQVKTEDNHIITFLDTPGHEAFTAMRARGANVTDIAVIVVAADDGVMPQTAEAINHAKAAGVPMIVAVNKMDKPGANPDRIKQQLTEYEVVPEEWGGSTIFVGVSALKKTGIKELLEQIHLLAEVAELKANPDRPGNGTVIESRLEKGRGNVATLLVQDGTVKIGQHIVAGLVVGRVKSLTNDRGEKVQEALPGMPVEVLGLDGTPLAGDKFDVVRDEKIAEEVVQIRREQVRRAAAPQAKVTLEDLFSKAKQGDVKELSVVLKCDVTGSMEAINGMFSKLVTPEVKLKVIHYACGGISESDVQLASSAKGIVVGFNVRPDSGAANAAKRLGVEIRSYSIVYELMDDMKKAMSGLLAPTIVEKVMGRADVRNIFTVPKIGMIGGCMVSDGKISRSNLARLIRDGKIVYEGKISSLKRFKDDAKDVAQGFECGIGIENFNDLKVGDVIEAFAKEEVARELNLPTAQP